jgi:UDP-arabinose 4-epimerase
VTGRVPILVTGGAGFVGSHTCKALHRAGFLPVVFDNLSTGHRDAVRFGPLVPGDVRDARAVAEAVRLHQTEAVVHFAGAAHVGESVANPALYYSTNVGGMIGLLEGCLSAGVDRIVFASSCAIYGIPDKLPIVETAALRPTTPYGRTKLTCEEMLADHAQARGLRFVALRHFNAAGADPEGELFERHDPETRLLPLALRAAFGQGPPLQVFGTDYSTPDGTCIRDYIHVSDLARAHVLALRHLLDGGATLRLNLGTGQGLSVRQILSGIEAISGLPVPVIWADRRPGDPPALIANPAEAHVKLGFRAKLSGLETLLTDAARPYLGRRGAA